MEDRDEAEDREENWARTALRLTKESFEICVSGNLEALPEQRSYTLRFRSVEPREVTVQGAGAQVEYDSDSRTLLVHIPEAPAGQQITVSFPGGLKQAENPVQQMVWQLLSNAQIPYISKKSIMDMVRAHGKNALAAVLPLISNQNLALAIAEIMTAQNS